MTGQFVDTVYTVNGDNYNGYLTQQVMVVTAGVYNLSFIYFIDPQIIISKISLDIMLNKIVVASIFPTSMSILLHYHTNLTMYTGFN